ncbi:MAG TPA: lysylphosphatidylglycerol synthase transmembrane domain-containing protein [Miltoncostaeaceae bacterium]|nr:lysylphosphatidylglycerol synthase transmembrane domain-containing protein [Miltoncostaeaceae bacterium]
MTDDEEAGVPPGPGRIPDPDRSSRPSAGPAASVGAAALGSLALAVVAWRLDPSSLRALGGAHAWGLLATAAALQLATLPLKAAAWRTALDAVQSGTTTLRTVLGPVAVGALFNLALAGRIGDAVGILLVHRRLVRADRATPLSVVVGSAITATLVSMMAWVTLIALAGAFVPLPPAAWAAIGAVAVATGAVAAVAAWRGGGRRHTVRRDSRMWRLAGAARRIWSVVAEGHRSLRRPAVTIPLATAALAGWAAQWGAVYAVLTAFHVEDPWQAAILVLVSISIVQTLPVVPGNVGVFQAAAGLPLVATSGVPVTTSVTIGVVLQFVQVVPIAIAGAVATARQGEELGDLRRAARRLRLRTAEPAR